jgi:hypothetical protein
MRNYYGFAIDAPSRPVAKVMIAQIVLDLGCQSSPPAGTSRERHRHRIDG